MTLEQLRIFLAVADREHVTRAAEALNLTQSATSAAIAALESRHAVKLFDRVGRRIVLTDAGRSFVPEARDVLARAAIAERMLEDLAGFVRGTLRIAASQTVGNYWLPPILSRFHAAHPGLALVTRIGNSEEATRAVRNLDADLALIEGSCTDDAIAATELPGDRMVLVTAPGAEPALRSASPEAVAAALWVLREPGSGTRAAFDDWVASLGLGPADIRIAFELSSNEAVRTAVEAGTGATVLSELVVDSSLDSGRLCAVPADLLVRKFSLLRHRERRLTSAERAFADMLSAMAADGPGPAGVRNT
ncbi:LysR family transcriptional regulator [Tropicimonas sp. IMCC34043]|uniref:LysR family transcriptional regulator n=1 Tax=Tropicimonas sp. IMCC34043 TaxID=2248760 RepID=UPI000E25B6C3|nr:LysR family transcriptional regulator [Tropicimonas sp. IMCC34043]